MVAEYMYKTPQPRQPLSQVGGEVDGQALCVCVGWVPVPGHFIVICDVLWNSFFSAAYHQGEDNCEMLLKTMKHTSYKYKSNLVV
mgnify:CR=1 FL=1